MKIAGKDRDEGGGDGTDYEDLEEQIGNAESCIIGIEVENATALEGSEATSEEVVTDKAEDSTEE